MVVTGFFVLWWVCRPWERCQVLVPNYRWKDPEFRKRFHSWLNVFFTSAHVYLAVINNYAINALIQLGGHVWCNCSYVSVLQSGCMHEREIGAIALYLSLDLLVTCIALLPCLTRHLCMKWLHDCRVWVWVLCCLYLCVFRHLLQCTFWLL